MQQVPPTYKFNKKSQPPCRQCLYSNALNCGIHVVQKHKIIKTTPKITKDSVNVFLLQAKASVNWHFLVLYSEKQNESREINPLIKSIF